MIVRYKVKWGYLDKTFFFIVDFVLTFDEDYGKNVFHYPDFKNVHIWLCLMWTNGKCDEMG